MQAEKRLNMDVMPFSYYYKKVGSSTADDGEVAAGDGVKAPAASSGDGSNKENLLNTNNRSTSSGPR